MTTSELLQSIQLVVDRQGKPAAVQLSIDAWESLIDWLEEVEDREAVRQALPRLRLGPERAGALRWDKASAEW